MNYHQNNHQQLALVDRRVQLLKLDKNSGGPAKPRNIGVKESSADYIAFLDADDIWLEEKLLSQVSFMIEKNLNFTSTAVNQIDENGTLIEEKSFLRKVKYKLTNKENTCDLIKNRFIATSSVIISKNFLLDVK